MNNETKKAVVCYRIVTFKDGRVWVITSDGRTIERSAKDDAEIFVFFHKRGMVTFDNPTY